jgi:hypothetical protein
MERAKKPYQEMKKKVGTKNLVELVEVKKGKIKKKEVILPPSFFLRST